LLKSLNNKHKKMPSGIFLLYNISMEEKKEKELMSVDFQITPRGNTTYDSVYIFVFEKDGGRLIAYYKIWVDEEHKSVDFFMCEGSFWRSLGMETGTHKHLASTYERDKTVEIISRHLKELGISSDKFLLAVDEQTPYVQKCIRTRP